MGRFGGMVSPFVLELGKINPMIPTFIISIVCYITAYTTTKLPETNKRPLLQEGSQIYVQRDHSFKLLVCTAFKSHAEAENFYNDFNRNKD